MAKFYGIIGYGVTSETAPDVYTESVTERQYFGDVTRNSRRWETGQQLNDNLQLDNTVSVVADPFALQHFSEIRYIVWNGAKWKVRNVEVQYPRLILTIGGVYNENSACVSG